jgi:WD40 repeat protein
MESIQSGAENAIFDEWDLALLEKVKQLLPKPDKVLDEVLVSSIFANEESKKELKRRSIYKGVAFLLTIISAIIITFLYIKSAETELQATINQKAAIAFVNIEKDPTFSLLEVRDAFKMQGDETNPLVNRTMISAFYNSYSKNYPFCQKIFESPFNIRELIANEKSGIFILKSDDQLEVISKYGKLPYYMYCNDSPESLPQTYYVDIKISPDGLYILALMSDYRIQVWASDRKLINTLKGPYASFDISPNGKEWFAAKRDSDLFDINNSDCTNCMSNLSTAIHTYDYQGNLKSEKCLEGDVELIYYHPNLPYYVYITDPSDIEPEDETKQYNYINIVDHNWKILNKIKIKDQWIAWFEISQSGHLLTTEYEDGTIDIWDINGNYVKTIDNSFDNEKKFTKTTISHDDSIIAITRLDSFATIYHLYKPEIKPIILTHSEIVTHVEFSPFSDVLVTGSADASSKVWNSNGELLFNLLGHKNDLTDVQFESEKVLYTSSTDGQILKWTLSIFNEETISIPKSKIQYIDLDSTDRHLLSCSNDNKLRIWDMNTNNIINSIDFNNLGLNYAQFMSKTEIIGCTNKGPAFYMSLMDKNPIMLKGHTKPVNWLSNLGHQIITVGEDSTLRFWNKNGVLLKTIVSKEGPLITLATAKQGNKIAVGSGNGTILIYDDSGKLIKRFHSDSYHINYMDITNDGNILVTASSNGAGTIWNLKKKIKTNLARINCSPFYECQYNSVIISSDQKNILTASTDRIARVFTIDGKLESVLSGHKGDIVGAYFSNDDNKIYTFSQDHSVRVWDKKGQLHGIYNGQFATVNNAVMNSTNKKIYSCSDDGTIRTWLTPSGIFDWMLAHEY